MKYLKTFENHNDMVNLYGTPDKRAKELIYDTLYYYYDEDKSKLAQVYDFVLSDISELIRNSIDHKNPQEEEYYREVEKEVIKIKNNTI